MASVKMELAIVGGEKMYFDMADVLDILLVDSKLYSIVFQDGECWFNAKINKSVYNRFLKMKEKRDQK